MTVLDAVKSAMLLRDVDYDWSGVPAGPGFVDPVIFPNISNETTEKMEIWLTKLLSALDENLWNRYLRHYGIQRPEALPYESSETWETELLLPDRYGSSIYPLYLCAQIDLQNGDYTRFNNGMALYDEKLQRMLNDYSREGISYNSEQKIVTAIRF